MAEKTKSLELQSILYNILFLKNIRDYYQTGLINEKQLVQKVEIVSKLLVDALKKIE